MCAYLTTKADSDSNYYTLPVSLKKAHFDLTGEVVTKYSF